MNPSGRSPRQVPQEGGIPSGHGAEVGEQMERILGHASFRRRAQLSRLLRYLVAGYLADPGHRPVQYAVGLEALGLPEDFDPESSASVRVAMNRLRRALAAYYADSGAEDPVVLSLPVPGYRLAVARRSRGRRASPRPSPTRASPRLVVFFSAETGPGEGGPLARALASEFVRALTRFRLLAVTGPLDLSGTSLPWKSGTTAGPDFLVRVSTRAEADRWEVRQELWGVRDRSLLASTRERLPEDRTRVSALAAVAGRWAEEIAGPSGSIDRFLTDEGGERSGDPDRRVLSEAFLAAQQYSNTLSEGCWERGAEAFRAARSRHPDHASLLAAHTLHECGGFMEYRARRLPFPTEAGPWAREALRLDPQAPLARQAAACHSYLLHRREECLERTRAIVWDPEVPRSHKLLPISCCLSLGMGCEELYPLLRALTRERTRYPRRVHVGAFVALLARGEDRAAEEELHLAHSEGQWVERLGRILLAERKGQSGAARAHAADLLRRFPDFPEYGERMLERRFAPALGEALQAAWENARP